MFGVGQCLYGVDAPRVRVDERKQILPEEMPKLHAVLRQLANPTQEMPARDQPDQALPAPPTTSQKVVAAISAQNGAIQLDANVTDR
jgi:hypothetical protein